MLIACFGFETGDLSPCAAKAGTVTADASVKHAGAYSLKVVGTGSDQNYVTLKAENSGGVPTAGLNASEIWITAFLRVATAPTGSAENVLVVRDSSNAAKASLRLSSSRTLDLYDSTGSLAEAGTTALSLNTWYRIELSISTDAYELRIDGAYESTGSMNTGANAIDHVCLGNPTSAGTTAFTVYFDDVAIDDAEFAGNISVLRLAPNANGAYTAWTNDWTTVDEVPYNATDYCSSTTAENMESENLVDAAAAGIPSDVEILAVKYTAVVRRTGATPGGYPPWAFYGIANGEDDLKDTDLGTPATSTWEMRTRTWPLSWQAGSPAWSRADIDTLQVGVIDKRVGQTAPLQCTMLMAEVLWRPPVAVGSATATGSATASSSATVAGSGTASVTGKGSSLASAAVTSTGASGATGLGSVEISVAVTATGSSATTGRGTSAASASVIAVGASTAAGLATAALAAIVSALGGAVATGRAFASCRLVGYTRPTARHAGTRSVGTAHVATRSVPAVHARTCSAWRTN